MANKTLQKEKMKITEKDIIGEVKFKVAKDAFQGPFKCHGINTIIANKKMKLENMDINYEVWECPKCKEEYVDSKQAEKLETIWSMKKILNKKVIEIERAINFDGKVFFLRFPKEITKNWRKGSTADIKVLTSDEFFVKVNN